MKKYKVNVNGTEYEIKMEIMEDDGKTTAPVAPVAAPVAAQAPSVSGGEEVKSPMPGNILDISVSVGDKVKEGQVIMILEAMKMENEMMAPIAGTINSIAVSKGSTVESGTLLYTIA